MTSESNIVASRWTRREFLASPGAVSVLLSGGGGGTPEAEAASQSMTEQQPRDLLGKLQRCLGGPWPTGGDLRPVSSQTIQKDGYRLMSVSYESEPGDRIPAHLLLPDGVDASHPAPAIAVWHQHNGQWHLGKSEPSGLAGDPMHHTGVALAREGYVVLCPDALCFEDRRDARLQGDDYERFEFLRYVVAGKSMAWKNILDMRRAIDYLSSLPEVIAERIGCYGHSMGSTHTWLVGPWEPRLKCLLGNCCLPTYAAIHRTRLLHCFPNFIPGWFQYGDTPDIVGLIAPRALHLNFGERDRGSPIQEVRDGIATIRRAYDRAGAKDQLSVYIEAGSGHVLSDAMWQRTRAWFAKHLRGERVSE